MLTPEIDPAASQPAGIRLAGLDVLLEEAGGVEGAAPIAHVSILARRAAHVEALEAYAPSTTPTAVDDRERCHVDLSRVSDRADPSALRRIAQDAIDLARVGFVLQVNRRPQIGGLGVIRREAVAVLAVDDRPEAQRVWRSAGQAPRARRADPGGAPRRRFVVVCEHRAAHVLGAAGLVGHVVATPVADAVGVMELLARVRRPGGRPEQTGRPHARLRARRFSAHAEHRYRSAAAPHRTHCPAARRLR